jgi:hypothetical protein
MNEDLMGLAKVVLDSFSRNISLKEVVNPSIPIMYFGDYLSYRKSKLKIITVGLNPSNLEFQENTNSSPSYFRFPQWEIDNNYLEALNEYFKTGKSYDNWFEMGYENVLNGLDASYYSKKEKCNIALHTDIFSPVATSPTWTRLSSDTKIKLQKEGFEIWEKLIKVLSPDIILTALSKNDCANIPLIDMTDLIKIDSTKGGKQRKRPYVIKRAFYSSIYTIIGRTVNIPFGDVSHDRKLEIGRCILADYNGKRW